jgi:hypothetical protein
MSGTQQPSAAPLDATPRYLGRLVRLESMAYGASGDYQIELDDLTLIRVEGTNGAGVKLWFASGLSGDVLGTLSLTAPEIEEVEIWNNCLRISIRGQLICIWDLEILRAEV